MRGCWQGIVHRIELQLEPSLGGQCQYCCLIVIPTGVGMEKNALCALGEEFRALA